MKMDKKVSAKILHFKGKFITAQDPSFSSPAPSPIRGPEFGFGGKVEAQE